MTRTYGKFKVGDRVLMTGGVFNSGSVGKVGTLSQYVKGNYIISDIGNNFGHEQVCSYDEQLELATIKIANTKTARKIHKDSILVETEEYLTIPYRGL